MGQPSEPSLNSTILRLTRNFLASSSIGESSSISTGLPLWLAFAIWFPPDKQFTAVFASTALTLVFGTLLAQIGRDAGKKRQKSLFQEWGGSPTTRALSYRDKVTNPVTLARYHAALNASINGLALPGDEDEEKADWKSAKKKYASASDYLREATRDKKRFPLIFAENVNFGFRRNLWGMKPGGIAISILALVAAIAHGAKQYISDQRVSGLDAACIVLCAGILTLWVVSFSKSWVRLAADEYATRLVAASEMVVKAEEA